MDLTACFVSASHQNVFFGELLDALAEALTRKGIAVERAVDHFPPLRDELVYVFVPHELLPLVMADAHPSEPQLRRSVTICTEQPGNQWFDETVRIARRSAKSVDINRLGAAELKRLGVDARFLQLGYVPEWDRWGGDEQAERATELVLLAGMTPRRVTAVARSAYQLAGRRTEIHMPQAFVPHRADSEHFLSGQRKWDMLSRSRLLLNVHRSELGYFEWQRAAEAIANGCVLLSEHSRGFAPLIPDEHFVSVSYDSLDVAIGALLEDEQRLSRIRASAYSLLREELPLALEIDVLAETIEEVAARPAELTAGPDRETMPRPKPPGVPQPEYERVAGARTEMDVLRMATKQLLLDQREMRRTLGEIELALAGAKVHSDVVERFGPERADPHVSVVLTVYNYADLVATAIDSVAASEYADYELVIVDDASSDGSGAAVRKALEWVPWVSVKLITRARNEGLAEARNLGVEHADGELVFMLDADNAIYPNALRRLVEVLDQTPSASFAYGIIEQFGVNGSSGLLSYEGWDPERLRYGNFVDAMAMLRRSALLELGGYVTDPRLHGWEDFALWCAFADRGWSGIRVPEILTRYRLASHSMISITNIDTSVAWSLLVRRFACLSSNADASALAAERSVAS